MPRRSYHPEPFGGAYPELVEACPERSRRGLRINSAKDLVLAEILRLRLLINKIFRLMSEICAWRLIFGVRQPCWRFYCPKPCLGQSVGEAWLRPVKAGAWLPHST